MYEILETYFNRKFPLSSDDVDLIRSTFRPRHMRKGDFLQKGGDIPRYGAFVCKGLLRSYVIDPKGKEHIVQFAPEEWWISDKGGAGTPGPSSLFIDAIEDSEVLLLDRNGHLSMLERVPAYKDSFQSGIQKRSAAKEIRIVQSLSASAEERYQDFLKTYPSLSQRVPQYMLASYLGITPETLSRVRRRALRKKN